MIDVGTLGDRRIYGYKLRLIICHNETVQKLSRE